MSAQAKSFSRRFPPPVFVFYLRPGPLPSEAAARRAPVCRRGHLKRNPFTFIPLPFECRLLLAHALQSFSLSNLSITISALIKSARESVDARRRRSFQPPVALHSSPPWDPSARRHFFPGPIDGLSRKRGPFKKRAPLRNSRNDRSSGLQSGLVPSVECALWRASSAAVYLYSFDW